MKKGEAALGIYQKILNIYPFLSKKHREEFEKKAKNIIQSISTNKKTEEKAIQNILDLLNAKGHADIKPYSKPTKKHLKEIQKRITPEYSIKNNKLWIRIPSWNRNIEKLDERIISYCKTHKKSYSSIVFDVRENRGGSSKLAHGVAKIFFNKKINYGTFLTKDEKGKYIKKKSILLPDKNTYLKTPLYILISKKCFSSNELFIAPFKVTKRAILVGEKTGGGSANPITEIVKISGKKYQVRIPTWRFIVKGEHEPIEKTKIKPDIPYKGKNIEKFLEKIT